MQASRTDEASLVIAAQAGDRRALDDLVTAYLPLVYTIVRRALGGLADVDDVVQETMLRALRELRALRTPESFRPWLAMIATRQVSTHLHRRQADAQRTVPLDEVTDPPDADAETLALAYVELSGHRRQAIRASRWLDPDDRALLALWWLETTGQLTRTELAAALGTTVAHAGVRVQRMRRQLEISRSLVAALEARPRCAKLTAALKGWDGVPSAWNKDVVATYKDGFNNHGEVFDFERGGPAGIQTPYWLTDDSISSSSWCYTVGIGYYTMKAMLHSLIDRVSKNGTMLINIAPQWDGTIPSGQRDILLGIGDYLRRSGESIYATRAWSSFGEGPTQMGGGSFTTPREGTSADIRFTRNKANTVLYATVLGWPGSTLNVTTLSANRINLSSLTSVQLLGSTAGTYLDLPNRTQDSGGLHITMPSQPYSAPAYVVKLTFSGPIPDLGNASVPTGYVRIANVTTGLALDSGGNVASGSNLKQWNWDGSTNLQWQLVGLGGGWYRMVNRTNGMVADSWGDATNGAPCRQASWNGGNNQQWRLSSTGNDRYQIINRGTNTALDGMGDSGAGSTACMWAPNSNTNNQWTITAV